MAESDLCPIGRNVGKLSWVLAIKKVDGKFFASGVLWSDVLFSSSSNRNEVGSR